MKMGLTTGIIIGGIVGTMIYMAKSGDINMKRTKRRIMRMGKDVCKGSKRMMSNVGSMMH